MVVPVEFSVRSSFLNAGYLYFVSSFSLWHHSRAACLLASWRAWSLLLSVIPSTMPSSAPSVRPSNIAWAVGRTVGVKEGAAVGQALGDEDGLDR